MWFSERNYGRKREAEWFHNIERKVFEESVYRASQALHEILWGYAGSCLETLLERVEKVRDHDYEREKIAEPLRTSDRKKVPQGGLAEEAFGKGEARTKIARLIDVV